MKHGLLLATASVAALALAAPACADQSAPPSYGVAAGWPGGAGQVTAQKIASPTLNTLSLSPLTATAGQTYTGTVSGDTAGSALTLSNNDGGLCGLGGHTVTCTGLTTGTANVAATETLAGATNSPKTTGFTLTVNALPSYSPTAVTFSTALSGLTTNGAAMTTAAGTVADTSHFTIFAEFRFTSGVHTVMGNNTTSYATDFISSQQNTTDGTESMPGIVPMVFDQSGWRLNIGDSTAASHPDQSHNCNMQPTSTLPSLGDQNWHWVLISGNLTGAGTTKIVAVYVDGSEVGQNCTYSPGGVLAAGISERGFAIRDFVANSLYTGAGVAQFGDVFADYTTDVVCTDGSTPLLRNGNSYACSAASTIPPGLIKQFWNSGPVDLGSNGSNALGRQPEIFLGHGAAPGTWMINKGAVNNLVSVDPQNTAVSGILYNSPSAPGTPAPAHKAYVSWSVSAAGTSSDTSEPGDTGLNTFASGDLILYVIQGTLSSGSADHGLASACPSAFSMLLHETPDSNTSSEMVVCTKTATGSETESIPSGTFTAFTRGVRWAMMDVKNVTGVRVSTIGRAGDTSGGSSSLTSPTVSGTSGDTLLTILGDYYGLMNGSNPWSRIVPGAGDLVLSSDLAGSSPQIVVTQQTLASTGTTTAVNLTSTNRATGAALSDWANVATIDLQPN